MEIDLEGEAEFFGDLLPEEKRQTAVLVFLFFCVFKNNATDRKASRHDRACFKSKCADDSW